MERTEVARSRAKIALLFLGSIAFVSGGLFLLLADLSVSKSPIVYARVAGLLGIIFFGLTTVVAAKKFFDRSPAIVIDQSGIFDSSSAYSLDRIEWNEIDRIEEVRMGTQIFIAIFVRDPDRFIQGEGWQPNMLRTNVSMFGTPILISAASTVLGHTQLLHLLQAKYKEFHN